ncbi:MAG: hypothetical protein ONB23_07145 [candidate division KSB1 bacterium]|nr:hypothetical protein [candidate division KSB1 bacterium]
MSTPRERPLAEPPIFRARFPVILKKFFWVTYDHVGKLMLASLLSLLLTLSFIGIPLAVALLGTLTTELASYRVPDFPVLRRNVVRSLGRSLGVTAVGVMGVTAAVSGIGFYGSDRLGLPLLSLFFLGITLWIGAGFFAWLAVWVPLTFLKNWPLRRLARLALDLALQNPLLFLAHLGCQLVVWLVGIVTVVGFVFLSPALSFLLGATFTRELLGQYEPGLVREEEEPRTLVDLFRPWQM